MNFSYDGNDVGNFHPYSLIDHSHSVIAYDNVVQNVAGGVLAGYNGAGNSEWTRYCEGFSVITRAGRPPANKGDENAPAWLAILAYISY